MSPGVLATMWKEEEGRVKELEKKMKMLLNDKGVSSTKLTHVYIQIDTCAISFLNFQQVKNWKIK